MGHYIIQSLDQTRGQLNVDIVSLNDGVNLNWLVARRQQPEQSYGQGITAFHIRLAERRLLHHPAPGRSALYRDRDVSHRTPAAPATIIRTRHHSVEGREPIRECAELRYCYLAEHAAEPVLHRQWPCWRGPARCSCRSTGKAEDRQLWGDRTPGHDVQPPPSVFPSPGRPLTVTGTAWVAGGPVEGGDRRGLFDRSL